MRATRVICMVRVPAFTPEASRQSAPHSTKAVLMPARAKVKATNAAVQAATDDQYVEAVRRGGGHSGAGSGTGMSS